MTQKADRSAAFFILTPDVRDGLLSAKLTAAEWRIWSYLASLDPFGDRGAQFSPAGLMLKCGVKKTTYFAAKAKFQRLGIFEFRDGITKVFNRQGYAVRTNPEGHSQQAELIESEISDYHSEISDSRSEISDSHSEISDSASIYRACAQTPQTSQTLQTREEEEKIFGEGEIRMETEIGEDSQAKNEQQPEVRQPEAQIQEPPIPEVTQPEVNSEPEDLAKSQFEATEVNQENQVAPETATEAKEEKLKVAPAVAAKLKALGVVLDPSEAPKESRFAGIPQDLYDLLKELEIPLDRQVREQILAHDISQAYGAAAHVQKTWETVQSPRGVFLHQLPKQPCKRRQKAAGRVRKQEAEFLAWYETAIAEGTVQNIPVNFLSRDSQNQPLVRLNRPDPRTGAPYQTEPWQRVRDGKIDYATPEESKDLFAQMRKEVERIKANFKPKGWSYGV